MLWDTAPNFNIVESKNVGLEDDFPSQRVGFSGGGGGANHAPQTSQLSSIALKYTYMLT